MKSFERRTHERINVAANTVVSELEIADLTQYDEHHHKIIRFLQTLQVPTEVPEGKARHFRKEATQYLIVSGARAASFRLLLVHLIEG